MGAEPAECRKSAVDLNRLVADRHVDRELRLEQRLSYSRHAAARSWPICRTYGSSSGAPHVANLSPAALHFAVNPSSLPTPIGPEGQPISATARGMRHGLRENTSP